MTFTKDSRNIIRLNAPGLETVTEWSIIFCKGNNEFEVTAIAEFCKDVVSLSFQVECPDSGWYQFDVKADGVIIKTFTAYIQT